MLLPRMVPPPSRSRSGHLYVQVLVAVGVGVALGHFAPNFAVTLKPLGDAFIKVIKMLIAPIVFATVVTGVAKMGDLKRVGRVGLKAVVYFEVMTTLALGIGLVVGELWRPGRNLHVDVSTLDVHALDAYTAQAKHLSTVDFLLNIIPTTVGDAFAHGEILQVLFFALLFGLAAAALGERVKGLLHGVDELGQVMFRIVGGVMRFAPLGALGAMAFTVGKYGVSALAGLAQLLACFYLTALLFVVVVLGLVCRSVGVSLWKLLRVLKDELLVVLGTSSSESALPGVMQKLESVGCAPSVVGLVIPMGYSFNLDGTSIYLTLATLFVAQATGTPLPLGEELGLLGILLLTSKGAATVTGGGFITLAATLSATGHIPVAGLTLLLGVDRFMSEVRALVNLVGNSVATLVVAKWEGELDVTKAASILR